MTTLRGLPPGRSGRVWLSRRLDVAERGAGLLETKLRILAAEEQRFALLVERTQREWRAAVQDADLWMSRARVISGQRGVRFATPADRSDVSYGWETTMGVSYPSGASLRLPQPAADAATPDSSALLLAREAYQRALAVGAEHAAASAALESVRTEVSTTRRRLRALQKRWTPRLEGAQRALAEALEEAEREDGVRMRWGARQSPEATEAQPRRSQGRMP
jgi:vacuolar-type H+-ATPase subunit D/Vma8